MFVVLKFSKLISPALLLVGMGVSLQAQAFKLALTPDGNSAKFTTTETFVGVETPFDPTGVTSGITGGIFFDAAGKVDAKQSKITVDVSLLKTDNPNRDRQLKSQSLETEKFANAILVPTDIKGLPSPLPMNGDLTFTLVGDLTLHGVTKPTTWTVTATAKDGKYVGKAKTTVRFDTFDIKKPSFPAKVLSIIDEVKLEYDFSFTKEPVK